MNRKIFSWIDGKTFEGSGQTFDKINPHTGQIEAVVCACNDADVNAAVDIAIREFPAWSSETPVDRGSKLVQFAQLLRVNKDELASIVARETGKPLNDALGEMGAAIAQADFFAGEGMRLYARSLTSGMPGKYSHTVRQPHGVAGLIVPGNTPIANIAWKLFPALVCGNTIVLKASEDAPELAFKIGELSKEVGIPDGVVNVVQGLADVGKALVGNALVPVISFTGSTAAGKNIAEVCAKRLARVSLELGGKNPFVVCEDADLDEAVKWASLSAFSNAGQRCASGSRIIILESVYDEFVTRLVDTAKSLKLGIGPECDLGPVITFRQHTMILQAFKDMQNAGGQILCGGKAPESEELAGGFYIEPTLIAGLDSQSSLLQKELFGPVATIQTAKSVQQALEIANSTEYGLTAAIHTRDVDRAMWFAQRVRAGVVNINIGTFGSEPHMPFGGFGVSGNGTREPGVEALDVYSELKNISFLVRQQHV